MLIRSFLVKIRSQNAVLEQYSTERGGLTSLLRKHTKIYTEQTCVKYFMGLSFGGVKSANENTSGVINDFLSSQTPDCKRLSIRIARFFYVDCSIGVLFLEL